MCGKFALMHYNGLLCCENEHVSILGREYEDHAKDVSGNITAEAEAVGRHGGCVHFATMTSSDFLQRIPSQSPQILRLGLEDA